MIGIILRRSSSLAPRRSLTATAAVTSAENLLHHQLSPFSAAVPPRSDGVSGEFRHFSVLRAASKSHLPLCGISDKVSVGREFHVKSGRLEFKAAAASSAAEVAVDDYGYDERESVNGGDEGLEIAKLGISQEIVSALGRKGITTLFPIQKAVLEPAMQGRDLFGRARTGTGKTLAFGIPIIDRILKFNTKHGRGRNPLALVLAPTRELARQVEKEFHDSAPSLDTLCVYGGTPIGRQIKDLDYGVDIVVGTPGRIIDLMKRGSLNLSEVQFVVLDEADQMLSVGFVDDIETIFKMLPQNRHSMLFSATMPSWIKNLVRNYLKDPLTIDLVGNSDKKLADGITLYSISSNMYAKASILGPLITEHAKGGKCIVFTQTKRDADRLAHAMARSFRCEALHGDITQSQRERTLSGFRDGHINILVATDVAARGLDVPNVDLVIHYELPNCSETFVHRSGRTGRAGKKGIAILVYTEDQTRQVKIIEREVGCRFTELPRITVEGGDAGMVDGMGNGGRFSSLGNMRERRSGGTSFGRSGSFGDYGSRSGGFRSPGFGRSDGHGQFSGKMNGSTRSGYNQPGNYRGPGFSQTSDSGRSDRSSVFGNFGSGRPSGFGESYSGRPGGDSRFSGFGSFGGPRKDDNKNGDAGF